MPREPRPDDVARAAAGDPPDTLPIRGSAEGTVRWWRGDKGYGAIATAATAPWDIWCHFAAIEGAGYKELTPGERVKVDYRRANQESFRYLADRVRRLEPGSAEGGLPGGAG